MAYEFLFLHAGPARDHTFFLCALGYPAMTLALLGRPSAVNQGVWSLEVVGLLMLSSLFDGCSQALDYAAKSHAGFTLFTIFHSSVTLFAAAAAVAFAAVRLSGWQWSGVLLLTAGLLVTAVPSELDAPDFGGGLALSLAGAVFLALTYPVAQRVFDREDAVHPLAACSLASLANSIVFVGWTCVYTIPNWQQEVVEPIHAAKLGNPYLAALGYGVYAALVGLHSLAYWFSIKSVGCVGTAVSKGLQQAGNFVFAHLLYCGVDERQCLTRNGAVVGTWSHMQKSAALTLCVLGTCIYAYGDQTMSRKPGKLPEHSYARRVRIDERSALLFRDP